MLEALANYVLDRIAAEFQEAGIELPERVFISAGGRGSVVHEAGEQLSISLEQIYSGTPGDQAQEPSTCDKPMTAVFGIELVRCIPVAPEGRSTKPTPVSPEALTESAIAQMNDSYHLMQAGLKAAQGTWYGGGMADVTAGTPLGGRQAMVMSLVIVIGDDFAYEQFYSQ